MTTNKAICDQQRSLEEEDSHLAAKKDNAEDLLDMITDDESESAPAIQINKINSFIQIGKKIK